LHFDKLGVSVFIDLCKEFHDSLVVQEWKFSALEVASYKHRLVVASLEVEDGGEEVPEGELRPKRVSEVENCRWCLKEKV
jgi:hypothetical protein